MEATDTIRAVRYIPGMAPHQVEIENTLEAMQSAVGGQIEAVTLKKDLILLCDEEGKMKQRVNNLEATALQCGIIRTARIISSALHCWLEQGRTASLQIGITEACRRLCWM